MLNIVIFGHSFIRRLRDRVVDDPSCRNLKLSPEDFNLLFRAQGGLTVNKLFKRSDLLSFHHPHIVYLQIGGNDLCTSSPADVVNRILDLVEKLITKNKACHVIIGHLFWRHSVATDTMKRRSEQIYCLQKGQSLAATSPSGNTGLAFGKQIILSCAEMGFI